MKNPQIVVHGLDRILAWEAWLTSLFSRVCLEPVVGLFESKEHRYIPARRTIFLQAGNGDVVSVHDSTWDSGSCYQFYSMVIELGHLLLEESLPLKLVQGFDRVSPLYERSMTLYGKDTGNVVARFQIAHYAEQPPISELPDVSFIHRRAAVLPVQLVLGGCLLRQPVGAVEVGTFLPLRELRLTGLRNFVTRPMLERGKLFLKVEELVMEGDSLSLIHI